MTIKDVNVGDLVWGWKQKRPYKVISRDERYIIIAKPFNPRQTFQYSIIDLKEGIMGPDDRLFGSFDYLHAKGGEDYIGGADDAIESLNGRTKDPIIEISYRHRCKIINFDKIESV